MKKTFRFVGFMLMAFASFGIMGCGGDDDEPSISVNPTSISMHYDESQQLKAEGTTATSWTVNDEFIASVDQMGLVKGRHIGSTQVKVSDGKTSAYCDVTITPKYYLIDTPLLNWGASMSSIKSSETHKSLTSTSSDNLMYDYTLGGTACILMYGFENNKLKSAMAILNKSLFLTAGYYLIERYQPIYMSDDNEYMFMDAMTDTKAKTILMLMYTKIDGSSVASILYADKSALSSTRGIMKYSEIPEELIEQIKAKVQ